MRISDWSSDVCSSDLGAFITQGPDLARAIVDLQTHFGGVAPGDCDVLRRGVDRRHLRAKPGERLRQKASAATDVQRRPAASGWRSRRDAPKWESMRSRT